MRNRWSRIYLTVSGLLVLWTIPAMAQSRDDQLRRLQQQVNELERQIKALQESNQRKDQNLQAVDQRVKVIDRKLETQQSEQQRFVHELPKVSYNYKDQGNLTIESADGANRFTVGGWLQGEGRYYTTQSPGAASTFLIRRARPYLEGTVAKYYDFRVMVDLGQGNAVLEDGFADIHYIPQARLRVGQFKEPVGLERLQDDRWNEFPERGLPSQLVPDRDIGSQFHGKLWHDAVEYSLGVFNGATDNVVTTNFDGNNAKDFAGRVFVHPFSLLSNEALHGFGAGFAGTYGSSEKNIALDTLKTAAQNIFFKYNSNAFAAGNRFRYSPQFYYYGGPFGLLGEFVYNSQEIGASTTVKGITTYRTRQINNYAWNITADYVLTGENASFDGIVPRHSFDPRAGYWGAVDLTARVNQLVVDQDVFNDGFANPDTSADWALEWGVGVNWWLARQLKLQTAYVRTTFHKGARNGGSRKPESAILQELQILF
jgi:phosphate-selective porin OprO/OprP